jgi:hypothetical protein
MHKVKQWGLALIFLLLSTAQAQEALIRINAGGTDVDVGGVQWLEDRYYTGGTHAVFDDLEIKGTDLDVIYASERFADEERGTFSYAIPVPQEGRYEVRLHFAEIWFGAPGGGEGGAGQRVFSVDIEHGAVSISDLDLNAEVGPVTALQRTFEVEVTDGELNLVFSASVNRAKVSGIEVFLLEPATPEASEPIPAEPGAAEPAPTDATDTDDNAVPTQPAEAEEAQDVAVTPPSPRPGVTWTRFAVHPVEGSTVRGSVLVRDLGELGTVIVTALSGTQPGTLYLSSLREGTCEAEGEPYAVLEDVRDATTCCSLR